MTSLSPAPLTLRCVFCVLVLPELVADDQLMGFWRSLAKNDILSVSYEQFAVGLDEKFGQSLWSEFPDIANKGGCGC